MSFIPPEIARAAYENLMKKKLYSVIEDDASLVDYVNGLYNRERYTSYLVAFLMVVIVIGMLYYQIMPNFEHMIFGEI